MRSGQHMLGWYPLAKGYRIVLALLVLCSALFFVLHSTPASALTTVPTKMNFQGRLTNSSGNIMPNGTYNMKLRLFTVSSGGTAVWSADRLVSASQGVTVTNGLFAIKLGDFTPLSASLFASGDLYLEVELPTPATATSTSPSWTEGAMTPRNLMATSAYAYNSETLDGLDSVAFGQLSQGNTWTGTNVFNADTSIIKASSATAFAVSSVAGTELFEVDTASNRVTIGDDVADGTGVVLVLDTKNTSGDPTGINGAMYYNSSSRSFRCYQDGEWRACIGALVASNVGVETVASSAAETNFTKNYTIPANNCIPGRLYRITARGLYGTQGVTAPALTVRVKAGSTALLNTSIAPTASMANRQWSLMADVICQTTGVTGTVEAAGTFTRSTGAAAAAIVEMTNTSPVTLDTTVAQTLQISVQWGTAAAANTITVRQLTIEAMGP